MIGDLYEMMMDEMMIMINNCWLNELPGRLLWIWYTSTHVYNKQSKTTSEETLRLTKVIASNNLSRQISSDN